MAAADKMRKKCLIVFFSDAWSELELSRPGFVGIGPKRLMGNLGVQEAQDKMSSPLEYVAIDNLGSYDAGLSHLLSRI